MPKITEGYMCLNLQWKSYTSKFKLETVKKNLSTEIQVLQHKSNVFLCYARALLLPLSYRDVADKCKRDLCVF